MSEKKRGLRIDMTFEGEESKLEKALVGLGRTRTSGVMIGTWPTPEMPKSNPGRDVFLKITFTGARSRLEGAVLDLGRLKSAGRCNIETIPLPE
jgi:hypothetical protein